MATYTPGPWECRAHRLRLSACNFVADGDHHCVIAPNGTNGKLVCSTGLVDTPESEATARLISAAPDLLHQLENALFILETVRATEAVRVNQVFLDKHIGDVKAAIAKAKGDQE